MSTSIQKKIRRIRITSAIILLIGFVCTFTIPTAYAANPLEALGDLISSITDSWSDNSQQVKMVRQIIIGPAEVVVKTFSDPSYPYYSFFHTLTTDGLDGISDMNFTSISNVIKIIGAMWLIGVALTRVFVNIDRGQDPTEAVYKILLEICIAGAIMINLGDIMGVITQLGGLVIAAASEAMGVGDPEVSTEVCEEFLEKLTGSKSGAFGWQIKAFFMLLVPYLISWLILLASYFAVFSALVELGLRRLFAPMAVADIYAEGLRSPGARYLKRYLAVLLKMAVAVLAMMLTTYLIGEYAGAALEKGVIEYFIVVLALQFTGVGLMFRGGEIANDVVGA